MFDVHKRDGIGGSIFAGVSETDLDLCDAVIVSENRSRATEMEYRGTRRVVEDFQIVQPGIRADPGAQRFGNRFFGGESGGVMHRRNFPGLTIFPLGTREDFREKRFAMPLNSRGDARHFHHVDADAENTHG